MHVTLRAVLLIGVTAAPLHAQAGCDRLDAGAVTQVIRRQRLATEAGRLVDDGGGVCRVTFGGDAGPTQIFVIRMELEDVATVRGTMQTGKGGSMPSRALPGVGDEAFVAANPGGDGAVAEVRDGTALVMVQVLTARGTERAKTAAAADVARLLFGRSASEPAAAAVASAPGGADPDPIVADPAPSPAVDPVAEDPPAAEDSDEEEAMTPIAIPPYAEGPADVCRALADRSVRELLAAAGLTPGAATTAGSPGTCIYTFGPAQTDASVQVTVQYAGARDSAFAMRQVAAMRRRPSARPLPGVGDEAAAVYGSGNAVIAYRAGLFAGVVELLAPGATPASVRDGAERVARAWASRLTGFSQSSSGDAP